MRHALLVKALVTGVLALGLVLPLGAILGLVHERQAASSAVRLEIQESGVRPQRLVGPILVVPFRKIVVREQVDDAAKQKNLAPSWEDGQLYFSPEDLAVTVQVTTERRMRGIYSALLYDSKHQISGSFSVPAGFGAGSAAHTTYAWRDAYLLLGVGDTRGIKGAPRLSWGPETRPWAGGTRGSAIPAGIHAPVGPLALEARTYPFAIELELQGAQSIEYVPLGKQTTVAMTAEWPHPSFIGQFLPESRTVTARGFDARWRTSHLATDVDAALAACLRDGPAKVSSVLGVSLIEPVNAYLQTERAVKYGFLFIVFTFVVFQLFELLQKLAIHPVQYGFVGVALAVFFLLLLALSEHIPFVVAYVVASASCVGLLTFYVSHVLRGAKRAVGFSTLLALLYAALYVLLRSEDVALLLGAILLFGILAAIMVVTRHVDWYHLAASVPDGPGQATEDLAAGSLGSVL